MARVGRGEIWLFSFPKPDKKRPVLVLTRTDMIGRLHTVTVAPITSTIRGVPSEVIVGTESGLKQPSAINLHNVATVPQKGLRTFVGSVPEETLHRVREALLLALGFAEPGTP
jgi:mRNA interferase MazF